MTYLSSSDEHKLNILQTYPKRPLTVREVLIKDIKDFDWTYMDSDDPTTLRQGAENKRRLEDNILTQLVNDPALAELALHALIKDTAHQTLFDKYPVVKYYELIQNPPTSGMLGLVLGSGDGAPAGLAVGFLTTLRAVYHKLPRNTKPSFVETPATPVQRETRNTAINAKCPALFGTSVSKETSGIIRTLFNTSIRVIETIERFDLAKEYGFSTFKLLPCPYFEGKYYLQTQRENAAYNFYVNRR